MGKNDRRTRAGTRSRRVASVVALALVLLAGGCAKHKSDADQAAADLQRGLTAHAAGNVPAAKEAYQDVLDLQPGNKYPLYNLGLIAQTDGDQAAAERFYRAALDSAPSFVPALFNLAIVRFSLGATQEAIDLYKRIIHVDPKNAAAHLNLGFALRSVGRDKAGGDQILAAVRLDPSLSSRLGPADTPASAAPPGQSTLRS